MSTAVSCPLTFGSLFAGIGGFDLGFERAGLTCKWQVEIDPYCRRVLAKHWPDVRRHDDVRTFPPTEEDWSVDVICGGFPCQDISNAGKRAGIEGERSGLWAEYIRIVRHLRPRFVVVENVAALLVRGMGRVLGDLAESGYDAEWESLPASAFGCYHNRDRVFICANRQSAIPGVFAESRRERKRELQSRRLASHQAVSVWPDQRFEGEPGLAVLVDGISRGMVKHESGKGLGNAVVPAVAEWIGKRLIEITQS